MWKSYNLVMISKSIIFKHCCKAPETVSMCLTEQFVIASEYFFLSF